MLKKIRKIINENRLYCYMAAFIMLVQAFILIADTGKPAIGEESSLTRLDFKEQLEKRQQALRELMSKNEVVAMNLGIISLFITAMLITGSVFLTDYIIKRKKYGVEMIPRTLDMPVPLWGIQDVFKIIILFLFFSHLFSVYSYLLNNLFFNQALDKRANITVSTGFMDLLVLAFILRFVIDKYQQNIKSLGVSIKDLLRNIGVAAYSYIGFLPVLAFVFLVILAIARVLNYTPSPEPIYELIFKEERPFLLIIISVLISIIGPITEEIFFRGFLYGALRKSFGISKAVFFSAFFFSILHTNILGFVPIAALGMFLAYIREKTGSLIPSISVHIIHNTALASLMFLMRTLTSNIA